MILLQGIFHSFPLILYSLNPLDTEDITIGLAGTDITIEEDEEYTVTAGAIVDTDKVCSSSASVQTTGVA